MEEKLRYNGPMATATKSLDLRPALWETTKDFARKGLLALAGVVAGIAVILFFASQWGAVGIGLLLISVYSLYHLADKYQASKYYLDKAKLAINH